MIAEETLPDDRSNSPQPTATPRIARGSAVPGTQFGDYKLLRKIAAGGMGEVYEAVHLKLDRRVALKMVASHLAVNPQFLLRFEREAKAAAALNHPNVVQVYDFGCVEEQYYLTMEFVDGQDLADLLHSKGRLEVGVALDLIEQTARALKSALEQKIIHRDIKPSNLLLSRSGILKVSDLGLAKRLDEVSDVTLTNAGLGSPHFLAPEQADDARNVDHRADIYSLGITLLYLLTGKRPFDNSSAYSIILAHAQKPLPTGIELGTPLPAGVESLVRKMAAKNPEERYQDYDALLADIARVKQGVRPKAAGGILQRRSWIAAAAVVVALAGLLIISRPLLLNAGSGSGNGSKGKTGQQQPAMDLKERFERRGPPEGREGPEGPGGPGGPEGFDVEASRPPPPWERGIGGPGGPGGPRRNFNGGLPLPMPRPPGPRERPNMPEGPAPVVLAAAREFARTHKEDYRDIVDRFAMASERAQGTQWAEEARQGLDSAIAAHMAAASGVIADYKKRMDEFIRKEQFQEGYDLWRDFPEKLRSWEVDQRIGNEISSALPRDFRPARAPW